MDLARLPIAAVLPSPVWKWPRIVNDSPGLLKKSTRNSPRSWNVLSRLVSRPPLNTPRPLLVHIHLSLLDLISRYLRSERFPDHLGFLKVANAMHDQGEWW